MQNPEQRRSPIQKAPIADRNSVVVQPDEGDSYWQPLLANKLAEPKLTVAETGYDGLSMGFRTIAPGAHVQPIPTKPISKF